MERRSTALRGPAAGKGLLLERKRPSFLATKIVPPRQHGLIDRPRLLAMASQLPAKLLTLIKAPAGFGKTSLAAHWSQRLQQSGCLVAWLTIDPQADQPGRFLFYVIQAMQRARSGIGAEALGLINETFLISPQAIISALINDLADVDDDIYLFWRIITGLPIPEFMMR